MDRDCSSSGGLGLTLHHGRGVVLSGDIYTRDQSPAYLRRPAKEPILIGICLHPSHYYYTNDALIDAPIDSQAAAGSATRRPHEISRVSPVRKPEGEDPRERARGPSREEGVGGGSAGTGGGGREGGLETGEESGSASWNKGSS